MTQLGRSLMQSFVGGGIAIFVVLGGSGNALCDEATPHFTLPPLDEFWAIVERPLLARSRRPNDVPGLVETDPENAARSAGQFLLVGTSTDQGDGAVAIVRDLATSTEFRVWMGDMVGGWQVKEINPRGLILVNAGVETSVTLEEPLVPEIAAHR